MAASLATYSSIKGGSGTLLRRKPRVRSKVRSNTVILRLYTNTRGQMILSDEGCLTDENACEGMFARRSLL